MIADNSPGEVLEEGISSVENSQEENSSSKVSGKSRRSVRSLIRKKHFLLDLCVLFLMVYVWRHYVVSKPEILNNSTVFLYYTTDAEVISVRECIFTGTDEEAKEIGRLAKAKYCVTVDYDDYQKDLYYLRNPKLVAGDVLQVRVSLMNKDRIFIVQ